MADSTKMQIESAVPIPPPTPAPATDNETLQHRKVSLGPSDTGNMTNTSNNSHSYSASPQSAPPSIRRPSLASQYDSGFGDQDLFPLNNNGPVSRSGSLGFGGCGGGSGMSDPGFNNRHNTGDNLLDNGADSRVLTPHRFAPMMPRPYSSFPPMTNNLADRNGNASLGNLHGSTSLRPSGGHLGDFGNLGQPFPGDNGVNDLPLPLHNGVGGGGFARHGPTKMLLSRREARVKGDMLPISTGAMMGPEACHSDMFHMQPFNAKRRPTTATNFPAKLHKILSDSKYHDYVDWLPHGRAWRILKPKGFEADVLPVFFRSKRYASFMRQVNGWGFKRITEGPDLNAYYHELFLRGMPQLCLKMRRTTTKAKGGADFGECPDFYKISMFAPLPDPDNPDPQATPRTIVTKDSSSKASSTSSNRKRPNSPSSVSTMSGSYENPLGVATTLSAPNTPQRNSPAPFPSSSSSPLSMHPLIGNGGPMGNSPSSLRLSSSNNSLSSWAGQDDFGQNYFPPLDNRSPLHLERTPSAGQVTPPARRQLYNSSQQGGVQQEDSSGLSVADLCYLTQQNRVLLQQARRGSSTTEHPAAS